MFFTHRAFWLPKDVEQPEGYQDAFEADEARGIAAIADGVASSLFAGSWAALLAKSVVADPPNIFDATSLSPWLAELRRRWAEPIDAGSLAWHQRPKLQAGASSTLLCVMLDYADGTDPEATGPIRLYAFSIGDCCLFHVRDDTVLRVFPIEDSQLFAGDPEAITSVTRKPDPPLRFDTLDDHCRGDDLIVLASDALAAWALGRLEGGDSPNWEAQWDMSPEAWAGMILELRRTQQIRYDDSTVVMLRVGSVPSVSEKMHDRTDWVDDVKRTIKESKLGAWLKKTLGG